MLDCCLLALSFIHLSAFFIISILWINFMNSELYSIVLTSYWRRIIYFVGNRYNFLTYVKCSDIEQNILCSFLLWGLSSINAERLLIIILGTYKNWGMRKNSYIYYYSLFSVVKLSESEKKTKENNRYWYILEINIIYSQKQKTKQEKNKTSQDMLKIQDIQ